MSISRFKQRTIDQLFRMVFRDMSDLFIFTVAFFSSTLENENENASESQFREAINRETVRRRLLKAPEFTIENFNREGFTQGDMEDVCYQFDNSEFQPTAEDNFVKLFTGRDRWAAREQKRRSQKLRNHNRRYSPAGDEDEF